MKRPQGNNSKGLITLLADKVILYDTTLRDGAQTEGVSFSTEDKLEILQRLDEFGIDFVEGGWPSSNPKDDLFFARAKEIKLKNTRLVAFGSTRRAKSSADRDAGLASLIAAGTEWICIFGKTWDLHVEKALQVSLEENLRIVEESVRHLKDNGKRVIFDAEHFFDGYKDNPGYALEVLQAAERGGAEWLVLCDTNGGSLPYDVGRAVKKVMATVSKPVGVHCHNDSDLAVACSHAGVRMGSTMVQGTINGIGERCGNANLCSVIPNLMLKLGVSTNVKDLKRLRSLSTYVGEMSNMFPQPGMPFVGDRAFAHKGGVHVSAMARDSRTYEHVDPSVVGNRRRILISEMSGTSNILEKVREFGIDDSKEESRPILEHIKTLESQGFQFEGAEASFELLVRRFREEQVTPFELQGFRLYIDSQRGSVLSSEASVKVVDRYGNVEHTAADGDGPVNALDQALRKALSRFFPRLNDIRLTDYKVRVIDEKAGTAAKVRVLIRSTDGNSSWTTVGVSENIIEASLMALVDSMEYILMKDEYNGD